jgi:hypothetical protein
MIVVVDIDDTLFDARWREPYIQESWDAFHAQGEHDKPILPVIKLVNSLGLMGNRVVLCTGVNERWRPMVMAKLVRHSIWLDDLLMRPDDDYRKSRDMKPALVEKLIGSLDHVSLVIDNREDILAAFRDRGITTLLVNQAPRGAET